MKSEDDDHVILKAKRRTGLASAIGRINYLKDKDKLNDLLDAFQSAGIPMGSDEWATHCTYYLLQLIESAKTLKEVSFHLHDAGERMKNCRSEVYKHHRKRITEEWVKRKDEEERIAEEEYKKTRKKED